MQSSTLFDNLLAVAATREPEVHDDHRNSDATPDHGRSLSAALFQEPVAGAGPASLSHAELVTIGYQLVLGRARDDIDEPGWSYWVDQLDSGAIEREHFFAELTAGAFGDGFVDPERQALNAADRDHVTDRSAKVASDPDARASADDLAAALDQDDLSPPADETLTTAQPAFAGATLTVEALDVDAGSTTADPVAVTAELGETGNVVPEDVSAHLEIVGDANGSVVSEVVDDVDLAAGEYTTVEFPVGALEDADSYTVNLAANGANTDTVTADTEFELLPPVPELAMSPLEDTFTDGTTPADVGTVTLELQEIAGGPADDAAVKLAIRDDDGDTVYSQRQEAGELPAEGDATLAFDIGTLDGAGTYVATATASAVRADDVVADTEFELVEPAPPELSIEALETAGMVGSAVHITATVEHDGTAETALLTLEQDGADEEQAVPLQQEQPGAETVELEVTDTGAFSAGPVEAELTVTSSADTVTESIDFGLYAAEADLDFTPSWQWADPEAAPFASIGQIGFTHGDTLNSGTGFLITPEHVMTNAHVASAEEWDSDLSELSEIEFLLGRNGSRTEVEERDAARTGTEVHLQSDTWGGDTFPDTDMAVVRLDEPVTDLDGAEPFDWFWNGVDADDHDLTGEDVIWSGYPVEGIDQGSVDPGGAPAYFQWSASGQVTDYKAGKEAHGGDSGGLWLSEEMLPTGGASGSPIVLDEGDGDYSFAGALAGLANDTPVAATLDAAAHDWALALVQEDGYLMEREFLDGPPDHDASGPDTTLNATAAAADGDALTLQGFAEQDPAADPLIA